MGKATRASKKYIVRLLRVGVILALNALAAYALWLTWPREGPAPVVSAGESVAAERPSSNAPLRGLGQAPRGNATGALRHVETGSRAIVARWIESARELSKNKVHSGNAAVAVCVRELGQPASGEVDLGAGRSLMPASNMKLVTTAAALSLLGPTWEFCTRVEASGAIVDGVLEGDLVLRAAGDPFFDGRADGEVEAFFAPLLEALAQRGLISVRGDVVLDEGAFVEPAPAEHWPAAEQHFTEYCALSGGFSVNRGCLAVSVSPRAIGDLASVLVRPLGHGLEERLGVRTVAEGKLVVNVGAQSGKLVASGSIPVRSGRYRVAVAAPDPVLLFGRVLCGALERHGIVLQGRLVRRRHAPGGESLCVLRTPLAEYLEEINQDSTNAVADQMLLALGNHVVGAGTFQAGARATKDALLALGVPTEGFEQFDGSGLSRGNRVSARQMVALLESVATSDPRSARVYLDSLAVSGAAGTLASRMKTGPAAGRVRAKTGFINGVSALSGFVQRDDARTFVFSILVNCPYVEGLNANCFKPMQDELCELLASVKP